MKEKTQHIIEPAARDKKLFCFGYGYTASYLAERLRAYGWKVAGTTTDPAKKDFMQDAGIEAWLFDSSHALADPARAFDGVTHVLLSIPPGGDGDPAFDLHGTDIAAIPTLEWLGYLSTTGVYGNHNGGWVSEDTPLSPTSRRGSLRVKAEHQWQALHLDFGLPLHIFRLAGIYGPGRSAIDSVRAGTARRILKEGHVFNRIHVEDIVQVLIASMNLPHPGAAYNLADDMPASSADVISYACELLGMSPPEAVDFERVEVAPIVRSFYNDNKRVRNDRIKDMLGVRLLYPDYQAGLRACFDIEASAMDFLQLDPNFD